MQHFDYDMDDLFRNASENYPLKIMKENWEAIADALIVPGPMIADTVNKKRTVKRYSILVLAVLSILVVGSSVFMIISNPTKIIEAKKSSREVVVKSGNEETTSSNGRNQSRPSMPISSAKASARNSKINERIDHIENTGRASSVTAESPIDYPQLIMETSRVIRNPVDESNLMKQSETPRANPLPPQSGEKMDTASARPVSNALRQSGKNISFYIGVIGGPQYTTIKGQGFTKPGLSAGVVAGFNLHHKFAFETGLLISTKEYFTMGEYFSMDKLMSSMPQDMKLVSLHGSITAVEIPLLLKYSFVRGKKSDVFGTAGFSSSIVTSESNKYVGTVNGNRENISGHYSNSNFYLAATVNISAGYDYKIGSKILLRFEPYIQIPARGIGVGSVPVLSTGIHLGVIFPR